MAIALLAAPGIAGAEPSSPRLSATKPGAVAGTLSPDDVAHYRAVFALQGSAQWEAADHEMAQITQPLLFGTVLAERYLSPSFHPTAEDLANWRKRYADLPAAAQIDALALHVKAQDSRSTVIEPTDDAEHLDDPLWTTFPEERADGFAHHLIGQFRGLLHQDKIERAVALLNDAQGRRLVSALVIDRMKALLAIATFADGRDADARRWAEEAAERSGPRVPQADWIAGLAIWRGGDHAAAAHHFEAAARDARTSPWLASASAFWAARANLVGRHPEVFVRWLHQAAAFPHTFYGLLARRTLGQDVEYSWENRSFGTGDRQIVASTPAGQRALALLQLNDTARAEAELRPLLPNAGPALASALLALANNADMPDLAVLMADLIAARGGKLPDSAQYPVPEWHPAEGWTVDRALIFALARQESAFNPKAKGRGGATGLLQLMPATARALGAKGPLTDPKVNLGVGQRYVRRLLDEDTVKGNLCFLAASYNVGPGTVAHWIQMLPQQDDALLFLESIPFQTTRLFVQRVLTNFWTYRNRFGQPSPSLDAIAAGQWPMYDGGSDELTMARHVEN